MSDSYHVGTVQTGEHMPSEKGSDITQPLPLEARNLDYVMPLGFFFFGLTMWQAGS